MGRDISAQLAKRDLERAKGAIGAGPLFFGHGDAIYQRPWYKSIDHALEVGPDGQTRLVSKPLTGTDNVNVLPTVCRLTFAQTYIWPVFRALCRC